MASNRMSISNSSGTLFPFFSHFCDAAPSWARTDSCGRVQGMLKMFITLKSVIEKSMTPHFISYAIYLFILGWWLLFINIQ